MPQRARLQHFPVASALALFLAVAACTDAAPAGSAPPGSAPASPAATGLETATFAGGCFWCMESDFDTVPGVVSTTSGYTGGHLKNPTYEQVSEGGTGHQESVQVVFDPAKISYAKLLDVFWHSVDPTDAGGQFCDRGDQYRSVVFVAGDEQRRAAVASKEALAKTKPFVAPIVTEIVDATEFFPAEDYHQDYHSKNPIRYRYYRHGCGRDARVRELWGDKAAGLVEKD